MSTQATTQRRPDTRTEHDHTAAPQQDSDLGRQYYYTAPDPAAGQGVTR